ncbi:MAG: primosomal protein N' (replication factor Y) - superfamily II helicase [Hasllibacter sp.]
MDDALPAAPVEDHRFPCPACGSDMRFDPASQGLRCDHCGNAEPLPPPGREARALALREIDLRDGLAPVAAAPATIAETTRVVACPNCGARTEMEAGVTAATCPYCDTPVVAADAAPDRHIKPAALLPFLLTERDAREAMKKWIRGLWFAPNALRKYARNVRPMQGVYAPHWTFDADTTTRYTGQRGVHRTETYRTSDGKTATRTRTDWYPARGTVRVRFDDVLVPATTSLPEHLRDGLEPWELKRLDPYRPAALAGFRGEAYTVPLPDAHGQAQMRMQPGIDSAIRRDIGGDAQRIASKDTAYRDETFKHVLLPLWIAAYRYGGKSWRFVVNGQSGKVRGERPYSPWKIAFAVILGLIAALAAFYLYDMAQNGGATFRQFGGGGAPAIRPAPAPTGSPLGDPGGAGGGPLGLPTVTFD